MPATRPRASFEPIPADFDVRTFVEEADNFQYVDRISYEMVEANGIEQFEKLVLLHVIIGGKPLVIDGFEEVLDPGTFTPSWLQNNYGDKVENARNLTTKEDLPLTIRHYLKHMGKLTEQFFDTSAQNKGKAQQRIYLKDIDCPQPWQDKVKDYIPLGLYYLNESTAQPSDPGALLNGQGVARAGDLMSSLPSEMRAENLMCYIGHEGTYTPAHREMCASLGQNIMVGASSGQVGVDGEIEHPGSSLWFMTETKDRHLVAEYWLSVLGHDIEVEKHFAQLVAWKKAPFKTYVVEQRPGDFILIPPLAPHQVWNRGTYTMKVAWNRTTVETLEMAFSEALPNSRIVCRDEQYKNKAIVYYTLLKYSNLIRLSRGEAHGDAARRSTKGRQVQRDFKRLFNIYTKILLSEMLAPVSRTHIEFLPYDSNVTCAYCRCNIFNRFLTCTSCKNVFSRDVDDPYDICMDCYCMGRSCGCQSGYTWVEQWKWKDLVDRYEEWRTQIIEMDGYNVETAPLPLHEEREYLEKKTLAQVCQEQLDIRPFVDIENPPEEEKSDDDEIEVNEEDGTLKKTRRRKKPKKWLTEHKSCHFCLHRHPKWKMAHCSTCDLSYCYGSLFRAHDMMPLSIMEEPNWRCPHCRKVCNTGACRRNPQQHPYEPKGTLLGHDTKKIADVRSIECLVDFSVSNLNWLREDEGTGQTVLQRRHQEAERAKMIDPALDARYLDEDQEDSPDGIAYSPVDDTIAALPSLDNIYPDGQGFVNPSALVRDHSFDPYYNGLGVDHDMVAAGKKRNRGEADEMDEYTPSRARVRSKKQKTDDDDAILPKRLLEKAKKQDRLIIVAAHMKGKSKIVKLPLRPDLLLEIEQRPAPDHLQDLARQALGGIVTHDSIDPALESYNPPTVETATMHSAEPILQSNITPEVGTATMCGPQDIIQSNIVPSESAASGKPKKKAGRPPKDKTKTQVISNDDDSAPIVQDHRPSDAEPSSDHNDSSAVEPPSPVGRQRPGPPSRGGTKISTVDDDEEFYDANSSFGYDILPNPETSSKGRRGRPSRHTMEGTGVSSTVHDQEPVNDQTAVSRRARVGRPSRGGAKARPPVRNEEPDNAHTPPEVNTTTKSHEVTASTTSKRGRVGRPSRGGAKIAPITRNDASRTAASSSELNLSSTGTATVISRRGRVGRPSRGRGRASPDRHDNVHANSKLLSEQNPPSPVKRKPGRPPKVERTSLSVDGHDDHLTFQKSISVNTTPVDAVKRKPGRPSKDGRGSLPMGTRNGGSVALFTPVNHTPLDATTGSMLGNKGKCIGQHKRGGRALPVGSLSDDSDEEQNINSQPPSHSASATPRKNIVRRKKKPSGQKTEQIRAVPTDDHNGDHRHNKANYSKDNHNDGNLIEDDHEAPSDLLISPPPAVEAAAPSPPAPPLTEEEENLRVKMALYDELDDDPFDGYLGTLAGRDVSLAYKTY